MPTGVPSDYGFSYPVDYEIELKSKDEAIQAIEACVVA
jgi:hypothetical protein